MANEHEHLVLDIAFDPDRMAREDLRVAIGSALYGIGARDGLTCPPGTTMDGLNFGVFEPDFRCVHYGTRHPVCSQDGRAVALMAMTGPQPREFEIGFAYHGRAWMYVPVCIQHFDGWWKSGEFLPDETPPDLIFGDVGTAKSWPITTDADRDAYAAMHPRHGGAKIGDPL